MHVFTNLLREIWMRIASLIYWQRRDARFIIVLGGPGAGKDTMCVMLAKKLNLPHLSTGILLRREIAAGTPIGQKWASTVQTGKFVPDSVIMEILTAELSKPEYNQGAVLNGIPRTLNQAKALRSLLNWWGNKVNRVVLLNVPEPDLIERISLRRTCSNRSCAASFHLSFKPPKVADVCDNCGSGLFSREDDKPEVVSQRLHIFRETFGPLKRFYETHRLLTIVTSNNTIQPQDVLTDVVFTIEQFD